MKIHIKQGHSFYRTTEEFSTAVVCKEYIIMVLGHTPKIVELTVSKKPVKGSVAFTKIDNCYVCFVSSDRSDTFCNINGYSTAYRTVYIVGGLVDLLNDKGIEDGDRFYLSVRTIDK